MTPVSRRIAAAAAALAILALSACAVPGQGDPGVAGTYGDRVVTNQQVIDTSRAFLDLGTSVDGNGAPLTLLLIGPDLISDAEKLGFRVTEDELQSRADQWVAYAQHGGEVTPAGLEVVHELMALLFLLTSDEGAAALEQVADDAEAGIVASPRYGTFTRSRFDQAVVAGINEAGDTPSTPSAIFFIAFRQVNGFDNPVPAWISGG